jgi:hypothetical protein
MKATSPFLCETSASLTPRELLDSTRIHCSAVEERSLVGSDLFRKAESILAVLLSCAVLFLLVIRASHAGALWRDECAAVQLARMSSFNEIARNFQHEAFPLLFPTTVRLYTSIFGVSDTVLRCFGLGVGLLLLGALWFNARQAKQDVPLLSLALLGLNTTFLTYGTSVRGYGLGCALIVLVFSCFVSALTQPSSARIAATAIVSVAAVQCLLYNLVLIIALALSASAICLIRRRPKQLIAFLGILTLCMISFIPYIRPYSGGSPWSIIIEFPITFRLLWSQFNFALGNPNREIALLWHVALDSFVGVAIWQLYLFRHKKPAPDWDLLLFGSLVAFTSLVGYCGFLRLLSYLPRSWYYLALLSILAVTIELLGAILTNRRRIRIARVTFSAAALVILPFNAWPKVIERQTNIDLVSKKAADLAKPPDLIVVAPWQYGISFHRYYHGRTRWITLPVISDLRIHRYDLFREKMIAPHPIENVLQKIHETLASGNRVWLVGGMRLPTGGRGPLLLETAPDRRCGWNNIAYSESWLEQMSLFVREHGEHGEIVPIQSAGRVSADEDVPLFVVQGWQ